MTIMPDCQARVTSRRGPCFNYAKTTRFGVDVCNLHARVVDRAAKDRGDEYALLLVRQEWGCFQARPPRVQADAA